ncbi:glycosyltransferase family A protein [Flavobacterium sp. LB2P84]|uniref:glycosyltransferase family 2 protein n=1 Tax=Flavobacterium yafengii TaxID=3041253 RepID=UPI0024A83B15|nr:glycosyltransferase family A protein [Flavobacterium yafengii]MDI6034174.1 glycosyltransferase family A protein [Flavobacterium yafengii]
MKNQLITIIVPCYNQAQYLEEALQSVLDQTYTDWECIIVNDGSPDQTEEVAKKWVDKDSRFKYVYKENGGLSSARNFGIEYTRGEFILPLDADDKISTDYISLAIAAFENDASLKVVYCKAERFGDEVGIWRLQPFSLLDLARDNMIFCSAMYKKADWELVGGYDVNMIYGLEDWEFWIAILKNGGDVKCLDEVGFYYRIKTNSMIKKLDIEKRKYSLDYISIKHADFFVEQFGSFFELNNTIINTKNENTNKLKSEKFVIDVFCNTFLGFSLFGLYKIKKH